MSELLTTILLARHGHVEDIQPMRFRGRRELPLTALGRRQAQALSQRITRQWQPGVILSSPLERCMATAAAIARPFAMTPESVADLVDIDYGAWQGLTGAEVSERWPEAWARWQRVPQSATFPDGESLQDLAARATKALHRIVRSHHGETVVIVAHDSVNRALVLHVLGLSLLHYRAIALAPCGLSVLAFQGGRFELQTLNETGHVLTC